MQIAGNVPTPTPAPTGTAAPTRLTNQVVQTSGQETGPALATPGNIPAVAGQLPSNGRAARELVGSQSQLATQALAGPPIKVGRNTSADELMKIAQEAATLPKGDPRLAALLDQLRAGMTSMPEHAQESELRRRYDGLAAAYMLVADKLRPEDLDAIADEVPKQYQIRRVNERMKRTAPFAAVLGKAAETMAPEDSARIRQKLRDQLSNRQGWGWGAGGSAQALGEMAAVLQPEDVVAIEKYFLDRKKAHNGQDLGEQEQKITFEALTNVLAKAKDPKAQQEVAWALQGHLWGESLKPAQKDRLVEIAANSGDPELKKATLESLPDSRIDSGVLEAVAKSYGQSVGLAIRNAPEGSPLNKMGKLLAAKAMAEKPEFAGKVNVAEIDRQINEIANSEPTKSKLEEMRSIASHNQAEFIIEDQVRYMTGGDMQRRLRLLPPEDAKKLMQHELHQLAALAPDKVQGVADALAGRDIQKQAADEFKAADPKLQEDAVAVAMQQVPGYEKHMAGCAQPLAKVIAKIPPGLGPEQTDEMVIAELTALAVAAQNANNMDLAGKYAQAKAFYTKASAGGRGPALINAGRVGLLAMKGAPQDPRQWAEAAGSVLKVGGDAAEVAKLFRLSQTGKVVPALSKIKILGPAGDIVGTVLSAKDMAADYKQGDYWGAGFKGIQTVAGGTSAVVGIMVIAGCGGPAAPAILLGATIAYFGAMALDGLIGDSDEVSFLKNLGVYQKG